MSAQPVRTTPDVYPIYHRTNATAAPIATNAIATVKIPPVGVIWAMRFQFLTAAGANLTQAQVESEVTNIKVRINGRVVIDCSPAHLHMLENYYGSAFGAGVEAGVTLIDWARIGLNAPKERQQYAIGTKDVTDIIVEFQLGTVSNLATIQPFISAENEQNRNLGPHLSIIRSPQSFATTGLQVITDLPKSPDSALLAYHIGLGAGTLKNALHIVEGMRLFEDVPTSIMKSIVRKGRRSPQTGYFHIDYGLQNEALGLFPFAPSGKLAQDWRLNLTWSVAPTTFDVYTEMVTNLA